MLPHADDLRVAEQHLRDAEGHLVHPSVRGLRACDAEPDRRLPVGVEFDIYSRDATLDRALRDTFDDSGGPSCGESWKVPAIGLFALGQHMGIHQRLEYPRAGPLVDTEPFLRGGQR